MPARIGSKRRAVANSAHGRLVSLCLALPAALFGAALLTTATSCSALPSAYDAPRDAAPPATLSLAACGAKLAAVDGRKTYKFGTGGVAPLASDGVLVAVDVTQAPTRVSWLGRCRGSVELFDTPATALPKFDGTPAVDLCALSKPFGPPGAFDSISGPARLVEAIDGADRVVCAITGTSADFPFGGGSVCATATTSYAVNGTSTLAAYTTSVGGKPRVRLLNFLARQITIFDAIPGGSGARVATFTVPDSTNALNTYFAGEGFVPEGVTTLTGAVVDSAIQPPYTLMDFDGAGKPGDKTEVTSADLNGQSGLRTGDSRIIPLIDGKWLGILLEGAPSTLPGTFPGLPSLGRQRLGYVFGNSRAELRWNPLVSADNLPATGQVAPGSTGSIDLFATAPSPLNLFTATRAVVAIAGRIESAGVRSAAIFSLTGAQIQGTLNTGVAPSVDSVFFGPFPRNYGLAVAAGAAPPGGTPVGVAALALPYDALPTSDWSEGACPTGLVTLQPLKR